MIYCLILGSNSDISQDFAYKFALESNTIILASRNFDDIKLDYRKLFQLDILWK